MVGPLTVGKKATKFGYRKFGKVGAIAFGAIAVGGYFAVKRKIKAMVGGDQTTADENEDTEESESQAEQSQ
ncbi:hypothetical protein ACFFQF_08135 [Haladaptatus pallidirubidus]|uniref:Uncharacterized protein n=1 Tax=Haladaptatus pallidirubidus TaxID=1008152 RepID=A0AAV3UFZ3_9EURY|nr:hypothetical protein [Haladaptatus pallidirubidus]